MTRQEEISEGLRWQLAQVTLDSEIATMVALDWLSSKGVVIKVNRELPRLDTSGYSVGDFNLASYTQSLLTSLWVNSGYVAVVPLVDVT